MTVRFVPKKPRRGLISITPDKKISDFRSLGNKQALYGRLVETRFHIPGYLRIIINKNLLNETCSIEKYLYLCIC